ncbi:MAG: tetratricopeptide repeat protein [Lewinellaceae bacterium]|nr:tetratricopeptide repeat protein [Lewinellaceae bacterium]
MKKIRNAPLLLTALMVLASCVTQKRQDDLSLLGKLYHNTTARYNGYFNANEIMMASTAALNVQHTENYNELLPVYGYMAADNPQAQAADLDNAIKKVSTVVALHRRSHWTDDCYLLAGQAFFLKKDYESAEQTFRYLVAEFNPDEAAKKAKEGSTGKAVSAKERKTNAKKKAKERERAKKEAERKRKKYNKEVKRRKKKGTSKKASPAKPNATPAKTDAPAEAKTRKQLKEEAAKAKAAAEPEEPGNYFLKHRPVFQEGQLWLARTLIERDNYDAALRILGHLEEDPTTFDYVKNDIWPVLAYYHLKRKEYSEAIAPLQRAVETAPKRAERARYAYLLAQLYQRTGQAQAAYAAFEQVLKLSPLYDMEFNARLNMAQNAWLSGQGTAAQAMASLDKLLKDDKNEDYRDQIYYAKANIALKNGDRPEAINNLQLALRANKGNRFQQANSYYTLGNLFFEEEAFLESKAYYDSTLQMMAEDDPRYAATTRLRDNLKDIAQNLSFIAEQDSLLRIADLTDAERLQKATAIQKKRDEERLAALANQAIEQNRRDINNTPPPLGASREPESTFFAYDDRALKRGFREFERKWGNRTLQDNWRRSNQRSFDESGFDPSVATNDANQPPQPTSGGALTPEDVRAILGNFPTTDNDRKVMALKMAEAYFKLGVLYREKLENNRKAVEAFTTLNERFQPNNQELQSWYYLYLAHTDLGESAQAQVYYDKLQEKYANTAYARVLRDPSYAKELAQGDRSLNAYYEDAYADFQEGNYQRAFDKAAKSKIEFGADNELAPRFALLAALCNGKLQGPDAYKNSLQELIARYPNTEEQKRAREILRLLGDVQAALPGRIQEEAPGQFKMEDDQVHYIIVAFDEQVNLNDAKIAVSDYNRKYHSLDRLNMTNLFLGDPGANRKALLILRRFDNRAGAMKYYEGVEKNGKEFMPDGTLYSIFAISLNNYREILRSKSVDAYQAFFKANYF